MAVHSSLVSSEALQEQESRLRQRLQELGSVLVAYSGGVDSAYLAWLAHEVLGERTLAILADSPSLARSQRADALRFAEEHGIPLEVVVTDEMSRTDYVRNDATRCFHCKDELFVVMERCKTRLGFAHIAYGMNVDDRRDFRPGQKAAALHYVLAPLAEAGLDKSGIRELARRARLNVWDKPASACLSSRLEYGRPITREALWAIEQAEDLLRRAGLRTFRVRHHGDIVRIEIAREEMPQALSISFFDQITPALKRIGFKYVTLDCEGFRSGSMNAMLPVSAIRFVGEQKEKGAR